MRSMQKVRGAGASALALPIASQLDSRRATAAVPVPTIAAARRPHSGRRQMYTIGTADPSDRRSATAKAPHLFGTQSGAVVAGVKTHGSVDAKLLGPYRQQQCGSSQQRSPGCCTRCPLPLITQHPPSSPQVGAGIIWQVQLRAQRLSSSSEAKVEQPRRQHAQNNRAQNAKPQRRPLQAG